MNNLANVRVQPAETQKLHQGLICVYGMRLNVFIHRDLPFRNCNIWQQSEIHSLPLSITELPSYSDRERKWRVGWEYLHVFLTEFRMIFTELEVIVERQTNAVSVSKVSFMSVWNEVRFNDELARLILRT